MTEQSSSPVVQLRDVAESDLDLFFQHQLDDGAAHMAAFTSKDRADRAAFFAHWQKIMAKDEVIIQTILVDGDVAGHVLSFLMEGDREMSYWIDRAYWGKGIATQALTAYLAIVDERPLYGRAAKDNTGSIRVLEKCGFVYKQTETGFANARGEEIEEVVMMLA